MKRFKNYVAGMISSILLLSALTACGGASPSSTKPSSDTAQSQSSGDVTNYEFWTFADIHTQFYQDMVDRWNEENPEQKIHINFTIMPFQEMHNKLTLALQSGEGAPDFCDVEVGKFPNYMQGEVPFADLTSYVDKYRSEIVPTRLEIYAKDGKNYGIPTHVGAVVAFYNTEILEQAGVDYTTIKTWDDYKAAGLKVKEIGHVMGVSETDDTQQYNLLLAEQGVDRTDDAGNPTINTPEAIKALNMLKEFNDIGIHKTIPGGHADKEEGYGALNGGEYATVIRPLWMMSRYTNYMDNLEGKMAIAPAPTFPGTKINSFGGGGTGTVVYKDTKNLELAAQWLTWAKLSKLGNEEIWNVLGFDPCNTSLWTDEALTHNPENKFIKYFLTNPFDVLNEIKNNFGIIRSTKAVPTIQNIMVTNVLPEVFESGADPKTALDDAQKQALDELAE